MKAMEGVWDPGADAEGPSGVLGMERAEGCSGNWGDRLGPGPSGGREAMCAYNRRTREMLVRAPRAGPLLPTRLLGDDR